MHHPESHVGGETGPTSVTVSTGSGGTGRKASNALSSFCSSSHAGLGRPFELRGHLRVLIRDLAVGQGADLLLEERPILLRLRAGSPECPPGTWPSPRRAPLSRYGCSMALIWRRIVCGGFLPRSLFCSIGSPFVRAGHRQVVARQERREERLKPVVILLEDRVELVIVAAAQPMLSPRNTSPVTSVMSLRISAHCPRTLRWLYS